MAVTMHATERIMFITFHSGHTILSLQLGNGHQKTANGFKNTARANGFSEQSIHHTMNYKVSQLQKQDSKGVLGSRFERWSGMFHFLFIVSFSK